MNTLPPRAFGRAPMPRRELDRRGVNDLWDMYASWLAAQQNQAHNGGLDWPGSNGNNNGNNGNNGNNNNTPTRTTSTAKTPTPTPPPQNTPPPTQIQTNTPAPAPTTTTSRPPSGNTGATSQSSVAANPSETSTGSHITTSSVPTSPNNVAENPHGSGSRPTPTQTDSNGNPVPPFSGFDPRGTLTVAPPGSTVSLSQKPSNKGLIAGLVIGLILLIALCALTVFFVLRRRRKQKREREQTQTADDTWLVRNEEKEKDVVYEDEKRISTPVSTPKPASVSIPARYSKTSRFSKNSKSSRGSRPLSDQSYATMIRARTPGGTPAIPIPYNPSEVSDDVSAHFTYFPQDDSIGVPVPYPLALHVPARVAQAMAERDEKWMAYEQQRGGRRRSSLLSYDTDATRPDLPRRSTLQSIPDTIDTDASSIMERDTNAAYMARQAKTQSSILDSSRSNMVNDGHDLSAHDIASSSAAPATAIRRLPPLPVPTTPPVAEQDENPFATERDVRMASPATPSFSRYIKRDSSDDGTVVQHGTTGTVPGPVRKSPTALVSRFSAASVDRETDPAPVASTSTGPGTMGFAPRNYRNPFADEYMAQPRSSTASRTVRESTVSDATGRSSAYSTYAGVFDHETIDGHGQAGNVTYKFPSPPKPKPS